MNITEVKVLPVDGDERLKAFVSMKIDDCFVVRDMKIISGDTGFFRGHAREEAEGRHVQGPFSSSGQGDEGYGRKMRVK